MKIQIYVAYHKDSLRIENEIFLPIHVGRANSNVKLNMIGDDSGENISRKNPIYCEMSAIYWAWKNDSSDYVGLCHYRRIFSTKKNPIKISLRLRLKYLLVKIANFVRPGYEYSYTKQLMVRDCDKFLSIANDFAKSIKEYIAKYDAIVPYPTKFATINVRRFFEVSLEHKLLMDKIIHELNPEFEIWYKKTMKANILYAANIFLFKKDIFNDYCNTVFPILEEHEKRTIKMGWCKDIINEKSYSRRSGYFGEFLTSAFISKIISEGKKVRVMNTAFFNP